MKLIIAEKPSVAQGIAKVVGANKKERGFISKKGEEYSGELYLNEDNELKIRYRK